MNGPDWLAALNDIERVELGRFGPLTVWTASTTFQQMPDPPPPAHEFNCKKGMSLLLDEDRQMSCAEIEVTRQFRRSGWLAGWLATCGRRNKRWHDYMCAVAHPAVSTLPKPLPLLPGRVASILARHGTDGYPDVVAWQRPAHPVFVELKGPGDRGVAQVRWLQPALDAGTIGLDQFVLVNWGFRATSS